MKVIIFLTLCIVAAQAGYIGSVGHVAPVVSTYAVPSYHTYPVVSTYTSYAPKIVYGGLGYSGLGYSGLEYSGLGYSGLGYSHGIVDHGHGHGHGHGHVKYILGKKK